MGIFSSIWNKSTGSPKNFTSTVVWIKPKEERFKYNLRYVLLHAVPARQTGYAAHLYDMKRRANYKCTLYAEVNKAKRKTATMMNRKKNVIQNSCNLIAKTSKNKFKNSYVQF
jgi:hypothetical protein